ncbi:MAG: sugar ABC transporter permease [Bacilli bacterium]
MFKDRKKLKTISSVSPSGEAVLPSAQYNKDDNVIVRLVGNSPKKQYQVSGIDDVVSKNNWKAWLYLAPVIILVSVFLLYPLINTIFIAFTSNYSYIEGYGTGLTLDNFAIVLGLKQYVVEGTGASTETNFVNYAVPNTLIITFITVPVSITLALIISVALNSIKWFQKFLQTVFFLPYVTNSIAIGMVFAVIFDKQGVINGIFNIDTNWILNADRWTAMIPLCIYIVWQSIPFKILILLSGLQGVDKQYYQAAQIDSASKSKILGRITIPLLSPQIMYLMITGFIGAFKEYTAVVAIFNGPSTSDTSTTKELLTVVYYVYDILQNDALTKIQLGAAAAVLLFVVILLFTFVQFKVSKRRVFY